MSGKKFNILISGDDGIYASGLWELVRGMCEVGEVFVVAPDRGYPGQGTGVTMERSIRVREAKPYAENIGKTKCYSVEGTPSDCILIGLCDLVKTKVDLVVTGINEGSNVGGGVLLSGTVGAAFHGYLLGIPAMAVSIDGLENFNFDAAVKTAIIMAKLFKSKKLPDNTFVSVSVPNLPIGQIKGVDITQQLTIGSFCDVVDTGEDNLNTYYWICRVMPTNPKKNTDAWSIEHNRIVINILALGGKLMGGIELSSVKWLSDTLERSLGIRNR